MIWCGNMSFFSWGERFCYFIWLFRFKFPVTVTKLKVLECNSDFRFFVCCLFRVYLFIFVEETKRNETKRKVEKWKTKQKCQTSAILCLCPQILTNNNPITLKRQQLTREKNKYIKCAEPSKKNRNIDRIDKNLIPIKCY